MFLFAPFLNQILDDELLLSNLLDEPNLVRHFLCDLLSSIYESTMFFCLFFTLFSQGHLHGDFNQDITSGTDGTQR